MLNSLIVSGVVHRRVTVGGQCSRFPVNFVSVRSMEFGVRVCESTVRINRQFNSLDSRDIPEQLLVEPVSHSRLAARVQIAPVLREHFPSLVDRTLAALQEDCWKPDCCLLARRHDGPSSVIPAIRNDRGICVDSQPFIRATWCAVCFLRVRLRLFRKMRPP